MPYIPQERRPNLERKALGLGSQCQTPGDLNFCLTTVIIGWLPDPQDVNYEVLNAAVGVLECVKQELYRRVLTPYEDRKRAENGEVFSLQPTGQSD